MKSIHSKARASVRRSFAAKSFAGFETLEPRCLMAVTLGVNAVANPGAEGNTGSSDPNAVIVPSGWTTADKPSVLKYGTPGFPSAASPGPASRGSNFFLGGNDGTADLFQKLDVSSFGSQIDMQKIKFALSAYLGGVGSNDDAAWFFLNFSDANGSFIDQVHVGPVSASDRGNTTGLLLRTLNSTLPTGTRFIQVQIHLESSNNDFNNALADNVSLILDSTVTTGSASGTVFKDPNVNGTRDSGEAGLGGVKVYVDKNNSGSPDSGEPGAITGSNGAYTIGNAPVGNVTLRAVVPSGYRPTSANPLSVTINPGATTANKNFAVTQYALITGNVFNDANNNKIKDATEKGIGGATVYLDFNNNGQFDPFELKTTTDSNGNYNITIPFGTYIVRLVGISGKTQTTANPPAFTLAKGAIASNRNFGVK